MSALLNDPAIAHEGLRLALTAALALLAGWSSQIVLDTGLRIRGLALFCGLAGCWVGDSLWHKGGWALGPMIADQAIVPLLVGTLIVSAVFKLVGLTAAGPRP